MGTAADFPTNLHAAITENPLDPHVWFNYGAIAHNAGDGRKAFEAFRRAVLSGPGFAPAQAQVMVATAKRAGSAVALAMGWRLASGVCRPGLCPELGPDNAISFRAQK